MPIFYDIDLRNAKLREFAFGTPWRRMPGIALRKLFGLPLPGTTDDPPVESLVAFEVEESALPAEVREQMQPLAQDLATLGFHSPIYHAIDYPRHTVRLYWATYVHRSGQAWGRIHCRVAYGVTPPLTYLFPLFYSALADGSIHVSSGAKQDTLMPETVRMINMPGASAGELWQRHEHDLGERRPEEFVPVAGQDYLRELIEEYHSRVRDKLLARGIFAPLLVAELELPAASDEAGEPPAPLAVEDVAVLQELQRMQRSRASVGSTLLILIVSLLLFVAAFQGDQGWDQVWVLVPALAFHELGHYLAMRWFGYRNLRMFFIPFLGAAVSGKHYNVAGWKKAVVALMGPVPGIVGGGGLGVAGMVLQQPSLIPAALLIVGLNGINLLPLLPLDGGWVVHAVLFVRHPILDVVFRGVAIVGMCGVAWLAQAKILYILPVSMLIALPASWRVARIARDLRARGISSDSPDAQSIPATAAVPILAELRAAAPHLNTPALQAHAVTSIFETLNARPPGLLNSLALLGVHAGSFVAAIALGVVFTLGMGGRFGEASRWLSHQPQHRYAQGASQLWRGPDTPPLLLDTRVTLIATFDRKPQAEKAYQALTGALPGQATLRWFGESVLLTLPVDDDETDVWLERLEEQTTEDVVVERRKSPAKVRVFAVGPTLSEAERLELELNGYLNFAYSDLLIPPWSEQWQSLPAADQRRYRLARQTLTRLQDLNHEALKTPGIDRRLRRRFQAKDQPADHEDAEELRQLILAEKKRLLQNIKAEADESVDREMLPLWDQLELVEKLRGPDRVGVLDGPSDPKANAMARKLGRPILERMAERMGKLPGVGAKPAASLDGVPRTSEGRNVRRHGQYLGISTTFVHTSDGLPALAEWLYRRGCLQVKYDFTAPGAPPP